MKMVAASLYRQGRRIEVLPQFSPVNYRGYNLPVSENLLALSVSGYQPVVAGSHCQVVALTDGGTTGM
ncbi:hypothetical protein Q6U12_004754 [Salmonella enterica subsp. enterica serovar Infantis]|nr:hypothetical protein [Salmonella enterica subsp. enterica serovar Infantis]ELK9180978.1 hypothetical protein [Salmonella enterica subsp. enterica serovar Infantis]